MLHFLLSHTEQLFVAFAVCCAWGASLGCAFLAAAAVLTLRFTSVSAPDLPVVPVSVLKPLHGEEPRQFGQLASFCIQNYSAPVQLIFGVQECADPAIGVVKRLESAFPEKDIILTVNIKEHGTNRKVGNIINMVSLAQHEVLVLADSDIRVGNRYLAAVIGELQRPGVGAVTCLYHGIAGAGVWSRFSALVINAHFLPQVVLALTLGLARPCFGATIAVRRETLDAVGGFSAFANCLADDYELGEAVRAAGYKVAIPPISVGHVCFETGLKSLVDRQVRFARTIKTLDPIEFCGLIITHALPLALIGMLLGSGSCVYLAAIALACRFLLCRAVQRAFQLEHQPYWLLPAVDLFLFLVHVAAFFGTTVTWRDERFRVTTDGNIVQLER